MLKIIKPDSPLQEKTLKRNEPELKFPPWFHEIQTMNLETFKKKIKEKNVRKVTLSLPMAWQEHFEIQGHKEKNKEKTIQSC
jgi:hypothetical protein